MYRSCSRCGKIHDIKYKCKHNKPKYNNDKYKTAEDKLRHTHAWRKKAEEIKESSQYLCEVCRAHGIYTYDDLETHHITKIRDDPSQVLDNNNLICLCQFHHRQADNGILSKDYLKKISHAKEKEPRPIVSE